MFGKFEGIGVESAWVRVLKVLGMGVESLRGCEQKERLGKVR